MPPKRKAPTQALDDEPVKKRVNRTPSKKASSRITKKTTQRPRGKSSDQEDELVHSLSKSRLGTPVPTGRVVMHSVEINTPPLKRNVKSPHFNSVSPSPVGPRQDSVQSDSFAPLRDGPSAPSSKRLRERAPTPKLMSLTKGKTAARIQLPGTLPDCLRPCLNAQKRAILKALQNPPDPDVDSEDDDLSTNAIAFQQLTDLLAGTVHRGEGNSCLLIGPRGSGKTHLVEKCIADIPDSLIIIRLSAWSQHNDSLAMREIARQLTEQTGGSFLAQTEDSHEEENLFIVDDENDENPFLDPPESQTRDLKIPIALPPSAHLPALISVLPTLSRPTVVVLDAFDLFALHPRQSLLYCLLDTVQSCRAGQGNKGVAVVGLTARVDTLNLLEKRVKSRFSGRMLRTAPPGRFKDWLSVVRKVLNVSAEGAEENEEWEEMWTESVHMFLGDNRVVNALKETFGLSRDLRLLVRLLMAAVVKLGPSAPFLTFSQLESSANTQRTRPQFPQLHLLPYPSICLLVAASHTNTAGQDSFTFEMLHESFRDQVRASTSAPVQVGGGGIGMVSCTRAVLMGAFEGLVSMRVFVAVAAPSNTVAKNFVKYRCVVEYEAIKRAVEMGGQTNLKKWLGKAQ